MTSVDYAIRAAKLIKPVEALEKAMLALEQDHRADIARVHPAFQASARNLLHYLALRRVDVRQLQMDLAALGLSSLGRMEAYTLDGVRNVLRALRLLSGSGEQAEVPAAPAAPAAFDTGRTLLLRHAALLLGEPRDGRSVRIMVTMPSAAATDPSLIRDLLRAGMDVMRINCAHDDAQAWQAMIDNLRAAERESGRRCVVYADLAGPKLRTGTLPTGACVRKVRPRRDVRGRVVEPVVLRFVDSASAGEPGNAAESTEPQAIGLSGDLVTRARKGDTLRLVDARDKRRRLTVTARSAGMLTATCAETVYFEAGAAVTLQRGDRTLTEAVIGPLPYVEEPLVLRQGHVLTLTRDGAPEPDAGSAAVGPSIGCTLPEVFACAQPGERVFFDDGKIGGRILSNDGERIAVRITQAAANGSRLQSEKGINLPDTDLRTPALTEKDLSDLTFIASRVDIVGMSFVRTVDDTNALRRHLDRLGASNVGTVLKIENRQAFENLPRLLLNALTHPPVGVMVARGDLAVELGFERLAEVQEQILWLCEAAHVPVIWATQVLDTMARSGMPSRAEVTDAVMSGRAECVMLNKGPYMVDVLHLLKDILGRMSAHQSKKRALLRPLSISRLD